ncbi:MAG TPA: hypothetical protein VFU59_03275 [Candidatus Eisenbacteria bacterium]|nr:hypothetical protein [Candidatus Eisenbacteria bacterium]
MRATTMGIAATRPILATTLLALVFGCAGSTPPRTHGGAVPTDHPRMALLPFENLSGREEQGRMFTQAFTAALVESDAAEVVDIGHVEATIEALRIRSTGAPTREQLAMLGESLQVRYVLLGSVLEAGTVRTYDGDVPTAGASLRLVDATNARIVWARAHVVTGDDNESVFGWGRERSAERLLTKLAAEMLRPFRAAGEAWRKRPAASAESR